MSTKMSLPGMDLMKAVGLGPLNVGNVLDTMGFVKKAWGAMNAPSAFMPTIDVEELKKRIVDLQAVEQWLVMNLGMIQSSIQALEVQKATIETLKGVTKGFVSSAGSGAQQQALSPEVMMSSLFSAPSPSAPETDGGNERKTAAVKAARKPKSRVLSSSAKPDRAALGATTWLEFLQGQFNQVAQAAMSGASLKANQKSTKAGASKATKSASQKSQSGRIAKKVRSSK
jgi:hypothetical protein